MIDRNTVKSLLKCVISVFLSTTAYFLYVSMVGFPLGKMENKNSKTSTPNQIHTSKYNNRNKNI